MTFDPGAGLPVSLAYAFSALVGFAFLVLPGLGIAWGLGRRADWSLAQTLAAAFAFEMAGVGVVALAAHYAGLSLGFVLAASAVLFAALTAAGVRLGRGKERRAVGTAGLILAGLAAVVAVVQRPWFALTADTFYHLAAVRSLLVTGRPMVTDPFYGTKIDLLDPTSGVWQTQIALVAKATGLDPSWLWPGATAVGAAMTLLAFWLLAKAVSRSEPAASAATVALLLFPLEFDMRWFAYPNRMSLAMIFLALAAVTELMERPRFADAALLVAAAFSAISLHMASAAVIVIATLFLGVLLVVAVVADRTREGRWEWRPVAALALTGLVLAVVSIAIVLPKTDVVAASPLVEYQAAEIASQTTPVADGRWVIAKPSMFRDDGAVLLFTALIGLVAAVPAFRAGDRRALAVFGIGVLPVALLLNPLVSTLLLSRSLYLTSRIAIMLRFPMYLGIAWGLAGLATLRREAWPRWIAAASAIAALVVATVLIVPRYQMLFSNDRTLTSSFASSRRMDVRLIWGTEDLERVSEALEGEYATVAGDLESTYYLAGIMPVSVAAAPPKHSPFTVENVDGEQRRADMRRLLDPDTPVSARRGILERRSIEYVLVPVRKDGMQGTLAAMRGEPELLEPVVETDSLVLFRVR